MLNTVSSTTSSSLAATTNQATANGLPASNQSSALRPLAGLPFAAGFPWAARGKPRRGMMRRAVFSDAQRQGLEKRFQLQKYISKPDRKKLAEKLGLKDSQVSKRAQLVRLLIKLSGELGRTSGTEQER